MVMIKVSDYIKNKNCRLIGPNCPGVITPEEAKKYVTYHKLRIGNL